MGTLSATLSPRQEQPCHRLVPQMAVLDSPAFNSTAVAVTVTVAVDLDNGKR